MIFPSRTQAEPGVLILGISQEEARKLAAIYRQNAFVFVESSGKTRMIATNPAEQAVIAQALLENQFHQNP